MAVRSRYFEPNTYYYKVLTLCFVLLVDIIFNSFTQFLTFGQKITDSTCHSDDLYLCIGLAVFQFIIIMIMVFVLMSIVSQTFFFKQGLMGVICKQFVFSFICLIFYPILFIVERVILGSQINKNKIGVDKIFKNWYLVFYVLKYISAFLFYVGLLRMSFELGKSKYYKVDLSLVSP